MPASRRRTSRVFTISFPEPLALQVEQTAREEHRNISELFREAWRAYKVQTIERRLEALRPEALRHAPIPSEDEIQDQIEGYVDEVRAEMYAGRKAPLDRRP
jgi:metal-responsive CopG/Arc/MetJ family transcriptional regulator